MVGKGVKRGAVALVPSASAFVSPAGNERTAMSVEREEGREGGKGEGEERRLLKVGGKFGSAAKLTQLSSPLLKRNFGSPTPALPACLCLPPLPAYFSILSSLPFPPCGLLPFSLSLSLSLRFPPVLPPTVLAILVLYPFLRCCTNKQCVFGIITFPQTFATMFRRLAIDWHRPLRDRCHSRLPAVVLLSLCTGRVNLWLNQTQANRFAAGTKRFQVCTGGCGYEGKTSFFKAYISLPAVCV